MTPEGATTDTQRVLVATAYVSLFPMFAECDLVVSAWQLYELWLESKDTSTFFKLSDSLCYFVSLSFKATFHLTRSICDLWKIHHSETFILLPIQTHTKIKNKKSPPCVVRCSSVQTHPLCNWFSDQSDQIGCCQSDPECAPGFITTIRDNSNQKTNI